MLEIIGISTGAIAIAEIGDKTQLLAIVLAARFRQPMPIIMGILVATMLNHAAAAGLGFFVAQWMTGTTFQTVLGAGFVAMAAWALIPDKDDADAARRNAGGVFLTTAISFFLVEIGDKTQIATSLLAARFHDIALVALGSTLGMMIANAPAVLMGETVVRVAPLRTIRVISAVLFALIGIWVIVSAWQPS